MAAPSATPGFPGPPHPTPSSQNAHNRASLRAPIHNPYDKFTQPEFDSWIGGITGALKRALGREELPPEPSLVQHDITEADVSGYEEDIIEDSFAEVKARRAAKGKERAIEVEDEIRSEDEQVSGDEVWDETWDGQSGEEYSSQEGESEGEEGSGADELRHGSQEVIELSSDEEETRSVLEDNEEEGYNSHERDDGNAEVDEGAQEEEPRQSSEARDSTRDPNVPFHATMWKVVEKVPEKADERDQEEYEEDELQEEDPTYETQPVAISDAWAGPSTYAEDFYSGGDVKEGSMEDGNAHLLPTEALQEVTEVVTQGVIEVIDDEEDEDADFLPVQREPAQRLDLSDPWSGPRTYAEDFYSGGDLRPAKSRMSPSHLTPLSPSRNEEEVGMTITPGVLSPEGDESPEPYEDEEEATGYGAVGEVKVVSHFGVANFQVPGDRDIPESYLRSGQASEVIEEKDFDPVALDNFYAQLDHETSPEIRTMGLDVSGEAGHDSQPFEEQPPATDQDADRSPGYILHERSTSPPQSSPSGHTDWNWPPAFVSGRPASRHGQLRFEDVTVASDEEEGEHEVVEISDDEGRIEGPAPLGTSDLDMGQHEARTYTESDEEYAESAAEKGDSRAGSEPYSSEGATAQANAASEGAACDTSWTSQDDLDLYPGPIYLAAEDMEEIKEVTAEEPSSFEPVMVDRSDFGDLPSPPEESHAPLPEPEEMLDALASFQSTKEPPPDPNLTKALREPTPEGEGEEKEISTAELLQIEGKAPGPASKPQAEAVEAAPAEPSQAEGKKTGPTEPSQVEGNETGPTDRSQAEETETRPTDHMRAEGTEADRSQVELQESSHDAESQAEGKETGPADQSQMTETQPPAETREDEDSNVSAPPVEEYIVTEVIEDEQDRPSKDAEDVMLETAETPASGAEYNVEEPVTEGRRTEELDSIKSSREQTPAEIHRDAADVTVQDTSEHLAAQPTEHPETGADLGTSHERLSETIRIDHGDKEVAQPAEADSMKMDVEKARSESPRMEVDQVATTGQGEAAPANAQTKFSMPPESAKDSAESIAPSEDMARMHPESGEAKQHEADHLSGMDMQETTAQQMESRRMLNSGVPMPVSADPAVPDPASPQPTPPHTDGDFSRDARDSVAGPFSQTGPHQIPQAMRKQFSTKSTSGLFTPLTEEGSAASPVDTEPGTGHASANRSETDAAPVIADAEDLPTTVAAVVVTDHDDTQTADRSMTPPPQSGIQFDTEEDDQLAYPDSDSVHSPLASRIFVEDEQGAEPKHDEDHPYEAGGDTDADGDIDPDYVAEGTELHGSSHVEEAPGIAGSAEEAGSLKDIGSDSKAAPGTVEGEVVLRDEEEPMPVAQESQVPTIEVTPSIETEVPDASQQTVVVDDDQAPQLGADMDHVAADGASPDADQGSPKDSPTEESSRPLKRKRTSPSVAPTSRLTRSMSSKDKQPTQNEQASSSQPTRRARKRKGQDKADHEFADDGEDTGSAAVSPVSESASVHIPQVARTDSIASSRASSVASTASLMSQPPAPRLPNLIVPLIHAHGILHHHHRAGPPAYVPRQVERQKSASLVPIPRNEPEAGPSSQPQQSLSQPQLQPTPSPATSSTTPVTRSNCRFHKISLPREENGPRINFVVPGCSLSNTELMEEQEIEDHGVTTAEDNARLVPDVEALDFSSYLIGILRQLVGVDLLREQEIFYLPQHGEHYRYKARRRQKARHKARDSISISARTMSMPNSPSQRVEKASASASFRSPAKKPLSKAESTSTTGSRARGSGSRRGRSRTSTTASFSPFDSELSDLESAPSVKRRRAGKASSASRSASVAFRTQDKGANVEADAHADGEPEAGVSAPSTQESVSAAVARRPPVRRSKRLGVDAAAYKPGEESSHGSSGEEQAQASRRKRKRAGSKRERTEGGEEDGEGANVVAKRRRTRKASVAASEAHGTQPS